MGSTMKKLNINYMYLEITRRCTLECIHCMRGNRQNLDMSEEILDNALKDVTHIHELDLGGGEPLLVSQKIESIINKIRTYGIRVDKISFTTNGTVLTPSVVTVIKALREIAPLNVRLSHDKFHLLELYIKKLVDRVDKNNEIFTEMLGYSPKEKYFVLDDGVISRTGRAKALTQADIDAINQWIKPTYYHLSYESPNNLDVVKMYDWDKEVVQVCGSVVISATGYLTQMDREYEMEDKGPIWGINIQDKSLLDALIQYENEYRSFLSKGEYRAPLEGTDGKLKK